MTSSTPHISPKARTLLIKATEVRDKGDFDTARKTLVEAARITRDPAARAAFVCEHFPVLAVAAHEAGDENQARFTLADAAGYLPAALYRLSERSLLVVATDRSRRAAFMARIVTLDDRQVVTCTCSIGMQSDVLRSLKEFRVVNLMAGATAAMKELEAQIDPAPGAGGKPPTTRTDERPKAG